MADTDSALNNLRYNQVSQQLEAFGGGSPMWTVLTIQNPDPVAGITQLTGDVTAGPGHGSQAASISSTTVTGKLLTGYVSGAGTVAATDSLLQAINKLNGNAGLLFPLVGGTIVPASNTTTTLVVDRADGSTPVFAVDTANQMVNVGARSTAGDFTVIKNANLSSVLARIQNQSPGGDAVVQVANDTAATCQIGIFGTTFGSNDGVSFLDSSNSHLMLVSRGASQGVDFSFGGFGGASIKASVDSSGNLTCQSVITPIATVVGATPLSISATGQTVLIITVGTATEISTITGGYDGQKLLLRLVQDGTGHAVTFDTGSANNVEFGTTITSFAASGASKIDYVGLVYDAGRSRWDFVSVSQGF